MKDYLGEFVLETLDDTEFEQYTPALWALLFTEKYGQIDGDHHKAWVIDQCARILHGTPVIVSIAKWKGGRFEYRFNLSEPSSAYKAWVTEYEEEGEYEWDTGIAP